MNRLTATILMCAGLMGSMAFAEVKCPAEAGDLDSTVAVVANSKTCYEASETASACAWGSSADVAITGAAIEVCARDYADRISKTEQKMWEALAAQCSKKYEGQSGTLYISFAAFCRLDVTKLFSQLYGSTQAISESKSQ